MLYCMLALSTARRRVNLNNLEADYMRVISHEEPVAETTPEDWTAQKAALEKQIQQLRSALHTAEKSAEDSKKSWNSSKSRLRLNTESLPTCGRLCSTEILLMKLKMLSLTMLYTLHGSEKHRRIRRP